MTDDKIPPGCEWLVGGGEIAQKILKEAQDCEREAQARGLYHRGWRFWPPYACGRCGRTVSASQFAFSRSCGGCDHGDSHTARVEVFDKRWFILGDVQLENQQDFALITPLFAAASPGA